MKFLKADGTIEEGTPLSNQQAEFRSALQEYLHRVVCHSAYHATYQTEPCTIAANFLTISVTNLSFSDLIQAVSNAVDDLNPKTAPKSQPEPLVYEEAAPVKPGPADDDLPL